jgi:TPP-dependent pyruvate/acetoin dehydrogenase alpha subunit
MVGGWSCLARPPTRPRLIALRLRARMLAGADGSDTMQLDRGTLIKAYRDMVTIRRFEERVQEEFSKGGIPGFVHLYAGEEASAVGVCSHLGTGDSIASTHRGHGHSIAKGCDVAGMMLELFGKQGGLCAGKGGSMHIADLDRGMLGANGIVGGGPPLVPRRCAPATSRSPSPVTAGPTRAPRSRR